MVRGIEGEVGVSQKDSTSLIGKRLRDTLPSHGQRKSMNIDNRVLLYWVLWVLSRL